MRHERMSIRGADVTGRSQRNIRSERSGRSSHCRMEEDAARAMQHSGNSPRRVPRSPNRAGFDSISSNCVRSQRRYKWRSVIGGRSQRALRDCFQVVLMVFAILQLVSGMIFAAIHVVLTFSPPELTSDLQNPLPIYLSAVVVALAGLCQMVLSKLQNSYMVLTGIFFSITSCVVSLADLLSASTVALPKFTSFIQFHYYATMQLCVAYTRWDKQLNGSFMGGIEFEGLSSCSIVESTLPPLTLTLVVFYGISCTTSFISCFVLSTILCMPDPSKKSESMKKCSPRKEIREDMNSSYVNYALELDDICQVLPENRIEVPAERGNKTNAIYLPGVGIPYHTLPYRMTLKECVASRRGQESADCISRDSGHQHGHTACLCKCRVVNVLTNCENPVVSASIQPPMLNATVRAHRTNQRPILPVGFRRSTDDHRSQGQVSTATRDRCRRSNERPLCVAVSSATQGNRRRRAEEFRHHSHHEIATSSSAGGAQICRESRRRGGNDENDVTARSSTTTSPPPYSELPAYGDVDVDESFTCDGILDARGCEINTSPPSVETLL